MKYRKACSVFSLIIGILMLSMWSFFLVTGNVPELETRTAEIILHLVAEFSTAVLLIISGILLLRASKNAIWVYPLSMGMLLYTLIVSPGYYIQSGDYIFTAMFGFMLARQ